MRAISQRVPKLLFCLIPSVVQHEYNHLYVCVYIFDRIIIFSEQKRSKFEQSDNEEAPGSFGPSDNDHDEYIEDSPERSPPIIAPDLPPYYPAIQGCRNVEEFNCLNRIEEGTYGVVFRALDKKTSESYAICHL